MKHAPVINTEIIMSRKSTLVANEKVKMISRRFNCVTIYAQNNKLQVNGQHRMSIQSWQAEQTRTWVSLRLIFTVDC